MGEYPLDQSAWRRGWNDTKTVWASWQFYILDAVVAVVIGGVFGWYWGLVVVLFGMFCVWMGASVRVPYKQRDEARALLKSKTKPRPLTNREKLIEAIAEAGIAVVEYVELMEGLEKSRRQSTDVVNVDAIRAIHKRQERYKVALESMEKQIAVAGSDYESLLKPLFLFIQSGEAILNASTSENKGSILNFKFRLDEVIRQAVDNIDELNQQASHKEGFQT